jgi:DNA-binding transcriptional ArsR family regulator
MLRGMAGALRRLDQVKAIADPLRLRIVEALTGASRTAKELAAGLGRKPTGLYHHLRVLESAGLIREAGRRRKRGTIERSFTATAAEVRIDPRVFAGRRRAPRADVVDALAGAVEQDLAALEGGDGPVVALRLTLDVGPRRLGELERLLRSWADKAGSTGRRPCHVNVIAYPSPPAANAGTAAKRPRRR